MKDYLTLPCLHSEQILVAEAVSIQPSACMHGLSLEQLRAEPLEVPANCNSATYRRYNPTMKYLASIRGQYTKKL